MMAQCLQVSNLPGQNGMHCCTQIYGQMWVQECAPILWNVSIFGGTLISCKEKNGGRNMCELSLGPFTWCHQWIVMNHAISVHRKYFMYSTCNAIISPKTKPDSLQCEDRILVTWNQFLKTWWHICFVKRSRQGTYLDTCTIVLAKFEDFTFRSCS